MSTELPKLKDIDTMRFTKDNQEYSFTFKQATIGDMLDFEEGVETATGTAKFKVALKFYEKILIKTDFADGIRVYLRSLTASEFTAFVQKFQNLFVELEKK